MNFRIDFYYVSRLIPKWRMNFRKDTVMNKRAIVKWFYRVYRKYVSTDRHDEKKIIKWNNERWDNFLFLSHFSDQLIICVHFNTLVTGSRHCFYRWRRWCSWSKKIYEVNRQCFIGPSIQGIFGSIAELLLSRNIFEEYSFRSNVNFIAC